MLSECLRSVILEQNVTQYKDISDIDPVTGKRQKVKAREVSQSDSLFSPESSDKQNRSPKRYSRGED